MFKSPANIVCEATIRKQKAVTLVNLNTAPFTPSLPKRSSFKIDMCADYEIEHSSQTIHCTKLPLFPYLHNRLQLYSLKKRSPSQFMGQLWLHQLMS